MPLDSQSRGPAPKVSQTTCPELRAAPAGADSGAEEADTGRNSLSPALSLKCASASRLASCPRTAERKLHDAQGLPGWGNVDLEDGKELVSTPTIVGSMTAEDAVTTLLDALLVAASLVTGIERRGGGWIGAALQNGFQTRR